MKNRYILIIFLVSIPRYAVGKSEAGTSNVPKVVNLGKDLAAYSSQSKSLSADRKIELFNKLFVIRNALAFKQLDDFKKNLQSILTCQ